MFDVMRTLEKSAEEAKGVLSWRCRVMGTQAERGVFAFQRQSERPYLQKTPVRRECCIDEGKNSNTTWPWAPPNSARWRRIPSGTCIAMEGSPSRKTLLPASTVDGAAITHSGAMSSANFATWSLQHREFSGGNGK